MGLVGKCGHKCYFFCFESGKKTFAPLVGPEEHGDLGSSMPASELHLAARNDELDDAVKFMEDVQDKARYSNPLLLFI